MCATIKANTYTVVSDGLELSKGSKFSVRRGPIKSGQLVLARINNQLIIGRLFWESGVRDAWLVQPHRWIWIENSEGFKSIGVIL